EPGRLGRDALGRLGERARLLRQRLGRVGSTQPAAERPHTGAFAADDHLPARVAVPCPAVGWLIWLPLIVLGALLIVLLVVALLARVRGGRYLRPIVEFLSKIPFMRRMFMRMSNAALEKQ